MRFHEFVEHLVDMKDSCLPPVSCQGRALSVHTNLCQPRGDVRAACGCPSLDRVASLLSAAVTFYPWWWQAKQDERTHDADVCLWYTGRKRSTHSNWRTSSGEEEQWQGEEECTCVLPTSSPSILITAIQRSTKTVQQQIPDWTEFQAAKPGLWHSMDSAFASLLNLLLSSLLKQRNCIFHLVVSPLHNQP